MARIAQLILRLGLLLFVFTACALPGSSPSGPGGEPVLPDTEPPSVVALTPQPGASGVVARDPVTLTFSESVKLETVNSQTLILEVEGSPIPSQITLSEDRKTATIAPQDYKDLGSADSTTLSVEVKDGITDPAGNPLTLPIQQWSWSVPLWRDSDPYKSTCMGEDIIFDQKNNVYMLWFGPGSPLVMDYYRCWPETGLQGMPTNQTFFLRLSGSTWEILEKPTVLGGSQSQTTYSWRRELKNLFVDKNNNLWSFHQIKPSISYFDTNKIVYWKEGAWQVFPTPSNSQSDPDPISRYLASTDQGISLFWDRQERMYFLSDRQRSQTFGRWNGSNWEALPAVEVDDMNSLFRVINDLYFDNLNRPMIASTHSDGTGGSYLLVKRLQETRWEDVGRPIRVECPSTCPVWGIFSDKTGNLVLGRSFWMSERMRKLEMWSWKGADWRLVSSETLNGWLWLDYLQRPLRYNYEAEMLRIDTWDIECVICSKVSRF